MARYKAIKPVWENQKEKQAKKEAMRKEIIFRIFSYIFVALLILGIIITGTYYDNDIIFGVGYITMSIITVWAIIFVTYTELKGWYKSIAYWKKREILTDNCIDKEILKNDFSEHRLLMIFLGMIFLGLAVYMFVLGIRSLLGIR